MVSKKRKPLMKNDDAGLKSNGASRIMSGLRSKRLINAHRFAWQAKQ